jgi:hypothetical protein
MIIRMLTATEAAAVRHELETRVALARLTRPCDGGLTEDQAREEYDFAAGHDEQLENPGGFGGPMRSALAGFWEPEAVDYRRPSAYESNCGEPRRRAGR